MAGNRAKKFKLFRQYLDEGLSRSEAYRRTFGVEKVVGQVSMSELISYDRGPEEPVTRESVTEELEAARCMAIRFGDARAAGVIAMDKARLHGLVIDKKQSTDSVRIVIDKTDEDL